MRQVIYVVHKYPDDIDSIWTSEKEAWERYESLIPGWGDHGGVTAYKLNTPEAYYKTCVRPT